MSETEQFLQSRPILAYQLDGTHLQNVLARLAKHQDVLQNEATQSKERSRGVERALQELSDRIARIEQALPQLSGGGDEVRALKNQLVDVSRVVDEVTQRALPDMQRKVDDAQAAVDRAANKAVQNALKPLEAQADRVLDQARKEMGQAVQEQKAVSQQLARERQSLEDSQRSRSLAAVDQLQQAIRALEQRVDHVERDVANPLRDAVEEMQNSANNNFQQIERANVMFDGEIQKLKAEMANLRSDLNQFENNVTASVGKIKEDLDTKFQMLVQMMQSFERNNQLFEQAVADAGQKLGSARAQAVAAGMAQFNHNKPATAAMAASASSSTPGSGARY